ncbi:hypothetical protein BX661DRAFT_169412 [Kickxella alabastrina]|uniref:uncharacterized protein n=1 Tax=Kickxella alabastrina TaxID=61397 RepID=UPI0022206BA7|nr:uncharacterized protein BX661DRAFT_169412 [Kickxella alabastrina]KAI7832875.1 hypothetical protein BX661DRAFT_169412 [Kickxella alabastrina]
MNLAPYLYQLKKVDAAKFSMENKDHWSTILQSNLLHNILNFCIIINALLTGEHPPCFLHNNASSESAEPESTATPETLFKQKPKHVRNNQSAPAASREEKQRNG